MRRVTWIWMWCRRTKMAQFEQAGRNVRLLCVHGHYADAAEARASLEHAAHAQWPTHLALQAC